LAAHLRAVLAWLRGNVAAKEDQPEEPARVGWDPYTTKFVEERISDADRIRTTAKWLIATFGAVGGVLIAGLQLSDIGDLPEEDRLLPTAGAIVGVLGVVIAVAAAGSVLVAGRVNLLKLHSPDPHASALSRLRTSLGFHQRRLRREITRMKVLFLPYDSLDEFLDEHLDHYGRQTRSWLRLNTDPDPGVRERAAAENEAETSILPNLNLLAYRLAAVVHYEDVRLKFSFQRSVIAGGVILAAIGAGMFAWGSGSKPKEELKTAIAERPVHATLRPMADGRDRLATVFGESCDIDDLPVIALSASASGTEIVLDSPRPACDLARTTVSSGEASVVARRRVRTPSP
jgi:hypothetical protein